MFNAERLLGGLLTEGLGLGRQRNDHGLEWQLGLGAVGIAIAAWEHFNQRDAPQPGATPPPPPPPRNDAAGATPTSASTTPPPPPPAQPGRIGQDNPAAGLAERAHGDGAQERALLLIRAMICAAHADGEIDEREQARIVARLSTAGLDNESRAFLERELAAPPNAQALFSGVRDAAFAEQIYVVSRLAVDVDATAEHAYLGRLASWLGLPPERVDELELQALGKAR